MLPFNLTELLRKDLARGKRKPDGKLHASSDLVGSLRHTMLRAAGAPEKERNLLMDIVTETSTFWHRRLGELLVKLGTPFMQEVNLTPWMPEGWSGTADWVFWSPEYQAFVLGDLKAQKSESFKFLRADGMKVEHKWQLSAYWYALEEMGLPLVSGISVFYLPKNHTAEEFMSIEPILCEADVLPKDTVMERMESRWRSTKEYLDSLPRRYGLEPDHYLTPPLAPVQDRVQKLWWDKRAKVWNVKLVPHWSADYCPYPPELCDCSQQGSTKIGHWEINTYGDHYDPDAGYIRYTPRKGYESTEPEVAPAWKEIKKRQKEINGN